MKIFLLSCLLLTVGESGPVIDLTAPVEPSYIAKFLPGSTVSGVAGKRTGETVDNLPLQIARSFADGSSSVLDILADAEIVLPISRNAAAAMRAGNQQRSTLVFMIEYSSDGKSWSGPEVVGSVHGTKSVSKTMKRLKKGDVLRFKLPAGTQPPPLQAKYKRFRLQLWAINDKYVIDRKFEAMSSAYPL
jgi:hypothetical protein